jgi:hypothetical protein
MKASREKNKKEENGEKRGQGGKSLEKLKREKNKTQKN